MQPNAVVEETRPLWSCKTLLFFFVICWNSVFCITVFIFIEKIIDINRVCARQKYFLPSEEQDLLASASPQQYNIHSNADASPKLQRLQFVFSWPYSDFSNISITCSALFPLCQKGVDPIVM